MKIKVKYLKETVNKIEKIEQGDWVDLSCSEDITLKQGEWGYIHLGVAMELPEGYEALLLPRSSTFKRYGIIQTNGIGVIDESYNGDNDEWMMPVYATRDITIPAGERVCQFRLFKHQNELEFEEVSTLGNKNRGGFGSTN